MTTRNIFGRMVFNFVGLNGKRFNLCYSWDVGTAHFIVFSTEVYFFVQDGADLAEYQYNWLEEDLKVY